MRLFCSITVLLIVACVILESAAAKSNRDTGTATPGNYKSDNSREVRYSKTKSASNKKGNRKEQEVVQGKKQQRHNVEANENIESNKVLQKDKSQRNGKTLREEQKRHKSNKQNNIAKGGKHFKNDESTVKVTKDAAKKFKRSVEFEQPAEALVNNPTESRTRTEDVKLFSTSRKVSKNKRKNSENSGDGAGKISESKGDNGASISTDELSTDQLSEETSSPLDNNAKDLKKNKVGYQKQENSKKTKKQKHNNKMAESGQGKLNSKETELTKEDIQTPEEPEKLKETIQALNNLEGNSYYLNNDGLIRGKKAKSSIVKEPKSSKLSSDAVLNDCKSINLDAQKQDTRLCGEDVSVDNCNLKTECLIRRNARDSEKPKYVDIQQHQEEETLTNELVDLMSVDENEIQDSITDDGQNCMKPEPIVDVTQEGCSTE